MKTIAEVQAEIERALECLPSLANQLPPALRPLLSLAAPNGARVHVSLRHGDLKKNRQIKSTAPADSWSPETDFAAISFEEVSATEPESPPVTVASAKAGIESGATPSMAEPPAAPERSPATQPEDPVRELVLALAKAERDPQMSFVALKWFRDIHLMQRGFAWAAIPEIRNRALTEAIDRGWILTSKVANPKNPQFPVTAIKANRVLPEVRRIVDQETDIGSRFAPVTLPGEPLSDTVLNARR